MTAKTAGFQPEPLSVRAFNKVRDRLEGVLDDDAWDRVEATHGAPDLLTTARKQMPLLLTIVESDLKQIGALFHDGHVTEEQGRDLRGTISGLKREIEQWGSLVELREFEIRQTRRQHLAGAIRKHRTDSTEADIEPSEFDEVLWALIDTTPAGGTN